MDQNLVAVRLSIYDIRNPYFVYCVTETIVFVMSDLRLRIYVYNILPIVYDYNVHDIHGFVFVSRPRLCLKTTPLDKQKLHTHYK